MTETIQPHSRIALNNAEKYFPIDKPQEEDNISLLFSIFDKLNNLYEKLNRLNYLIERKNIEQLLYRKYKGEKK
ncbi:MAG: hypothetical protein LBC76_08510 [Treponema sp.]|jgi:hypothetical protein|nr:hypothetical protein [Treponema sp.]